MSQASNKRRTRALSLIWFLAAAALPALVWHDAAASLASRFTLNLGYLLTAWSGFALIAIGLVLFVPVLASVGRSPESRLYPRNRNTLVAWGTSLYLLGTALSAQIAQITGNV